MRRGSLAGAVAAAVWAGSDPVLHRVFGIPWYSDVRLLGRLATRGRFWPVVGTAAHVANGAVFGAVFRRLGGRGPLAGLIAAQGENAVLWPVLAVMDRIHPDRRNGDWPRLLTNRGVAAYEFAGHA